MNDADVRNLEPLGLSTGECEEERLRLVKAAANPLLEACRVLLRALADLPKISELSPASLKALRNALVMEVGVLNSLCVKANVRTDHVIAARYCLCTALDEVAMQSSWAQVNGNSDIWAARSLINTCGMDGQGGDKIYLLVGRLMQDAAEHRDLLEVIYRILSLGFEGRFRHIADGSRKHHAVRTQIFNVISGGRGAVPMALSPHAKTDVRRGRFSTWVFPVWVTALACAALLLGVYGYDKYQLSTASEAQVRRLQSIARLKPEAPAVLQLKVLLQKEIADGLVSVDEDQRRSTVTFRGDAMFAPGAVVLRSGVEPLIQKISAELLKVRGNVTVTGYTDNVPIRSRRFASNQALSESRAVQVMQLLQTAGLPDDRLVANGMGEEDPIADNSTPQGRAQNRRVAISVAN